MYYYEIYDEGNFLSKSDEFSEENCSFDPYEECVEDATDELEALVNDGSDPTEVIAKIYENGTLVDEINYGERR